MPASRFSTLQWALLISLGLHALLLVVRIAAPEQFNRLFSDTPLEVVLVNTKGDAKPVKAQALAQANLAGGGDAAGGLSTTPLPPSPAPTLGDAMEDQRAQIAQLQAVQQQLLAQMRRELALLPPPDPEREQATEQGRAQAERRRYLVQQLGVIEKRVNEENARPRRRYVSPATQEVAYAQYYDRLRRRIEQRGTRDFPTVAGRKLYGELTMNIHISLEGRVVQTEIVVSSGNPALDRRAGAIVRAAAPFGVFSDAMRREAEELVVTSRFRFTREDGLETTLTARP